MKQILLTQGKYALVDDEDYENLAKFKWHAGQYGKTWYAKRLVWDSKLKKGKITRMHHYVMPLREGLMVDHINGNGLDNRKSNLRLVTKAQNMMNAGRRRNTGKWGVGVAWHKQNSKWRAYITLSKRQISLGCFDNPEEAQRARREGEKKFFKEFAFHTVDI